MHAALVRVTARFVIVSHQQFTALTLARRRPLRPRETRRDARDAFYPRSRPSRRVSARAARRARDSAIGYFRFHTFVPLTVSLRKVRVSTRAAVDGFVPLATIFPHTPTFASARGPIARESRAQTFP